MEQEAVQSERPCHLSRSQVRASGPSCPITCQLIEGCFNNVYTQCLITITVYLTTGKYFWLNFTLEIYVTKHLYLRHKVKKSWSLLTGKSGGNGS